MARRQPFALVYDPDVKVHLQAIGPEHCGSIRRTIEEQLRFEPDRATRNRKPLERPVAFEATWELRFGPDKRIRVFYRLDHQRREVHILAIGIKEGNRLTVGRKEIQL